MAIAPSLVVARRVKTMDVLEALSVLMIERGVPAYIRSDNVPEFVAKVLRQWLSSVGVQAAYIELGSPWENGCGKYTSGWSRRSDRPAPLLTDERWSVFGTDDGFPDLSAWTDDYINILAPLSKKWANYN